MDKKLFASSSVLGLKNPAKPFPVNQDAGVLRWRYQTNDEANIPLSSKYQDQLELFLFCFVLFFCYLCALGPVYTKHQRQLCDDASVTVLIENNGVAGKWVATPFWSDSIVFNENSIDDAGAWCKRALSTNWTKAKLFTSCFMYYVSIYTSNSLLFSLKS